MQPRKILIVEDDLSLRRLMKIQATSLRYDLSEAQNGMDALMLAKAILPDVIITDVMMPVMTGLELISALKKDDALKHIPVIVVTAGEVQLQKQALDAGAFTVLSKPVRKKNLITVIESALSSLPPQQSDAQSQAAVDAEDF